MQTCRPLALLLALLCLAISPAGCSSMLTNKPIAPTVSVTRVVPLNLSLRDSRLNFTLRVSNPNSFDLPLQSLDFIVYFAGSKVANGKSFEAVTIPANGEALLDVEVVAALSKLWGQFKSMFDEQDFSVKYSVAGAAKLANWPTRIPFDVQRTLQSPTLE